MLVARVPAGTDEGAFVGVVADADTVKESAKDAVSQLQERSVDVMMITGDNERTARAVAEQVGIDPENVHAEVLPEDKSDAVEAIQDEGRKAMMVGDGVNDAPALAVAYVGTAIGSGTDVAIEAADVTLMRDDPLDVVKAIRISDATLQKIKQNLVWALGLQHGDDPVGFTRAASARPRRRRDGLLECVGAVEQSTVPSVHSGSRLRAPRPPPVNYPTLLAHG